MIIVAIANCQGKVAQVEIANCKLQDTERNGAEHRVCSEECERDVVSDIFLFLLPLLLLFLLFLPFFTFPFLFPLFWHLLLFPSLLLFLLYLYVFAPVPSLSFPLCSCSFPFSPPLPPHPTLAPPPKSSLTPHLRTLFIQSHEQNFLIPLPAVLISLLWPFDAVQLFTPLFKVLCLAAVLSPAC